MKIGIWLDSDYSSTMGGSFSYYDRLITGIDNYTFAKELEICFITTGHKSPTLKHPVIQLSFSQTIPFFEKLKLHIPLVRSQTRKRIATQTDRLRKDSYAKTLKENDIRLIFYPTPYLCELPDFPFIITHWDIGHRSTFSFPEVSEETTFHDREEFYNNILPKALLIFTESEAGKQELLRYTHLCSNRIKTVPLFAGNCATLYSSLQQQLDILQQFNLEKNKYFYYPAQFWAHKNHHTLLHAFNLFIKDNPDYKLVFSGSDQGNLNYIKQIVNNLHLNKSVVFAGFVSNIIVGTLYRNATSLIMPTMMGPTNMPLLEAMELGCPVICSDMAGHREELGDAAIYCDPMSVDELLGSMKLMVKHRDEYVERIKIQRENTPFKIEMALERINQYLCVAAAIRSAWE